MHSDWHWFFCTLVLQDGFPQKSLFKMLKGCLTLLRPLEFCVLPEKYFEDFGNISKQWNKLSIVRYWAQEMSKFFHIAVFLYVLYGWHFLSSDCIPWSEIGWPKKWRFFLKNWNLLSFNYRFAFLRCLKTASKWCRCPFMMHCRSICLRDKQSKTLVLTRPVT